jgi:uncharacterized surface protein with fasciclin (FAS1) repeats
MSKPNTTLMTAGLLAAGLSLSAIGAVRAFAPAGADAMTADSGLSGSQVNVPSLYDEAHAAAGSLRGRPAASAVGQPVSLEFMISLLRTASFGTGAPAPAQWTLFLPTDAAFAHLAGAPLDALIHQPNALRTLVDRHLAVGDSTLDELALGASASSLAGQPLQVTEADQGPRVNGVSVLAQLEVGNGRVFIVDGLLEAPSRRPCAGPLTSIARTVGRAGALLRHSRSRS